MKTNRDAWCSMSSIRYAKVLFDLGLSREETDRAERIVEETPEVVRVLHNPVVTKKKNIR